MRLVVLVHSPIAPQVVFLLVPPLVVDFVGQEHILRYSRLRLVQIVLDTTVLPIVSRGMPGLPGMPSLVPQFVLLFTFYLLVTPLDYLPLQELRFFRVVLVSIVDFGRFQ